MSPFVEELLELWDGVDIFIQSHTYRIRTALICTTCDLPATRKLLGFASFNSTHGCSKCFQVFPYVKELDKPDFSDFSSCKHRDIQSHRKYCKKFIEARTKTGKAKLVTENGVRYTVLLKLPYFNPIHFHVIDPMHNLLLGTAKHDMETWIDCGVLTKAAIQNIQSTVESIHARVDVGRIPSKISCNFAGFKADQWRNWVLIYSPIALKGNVDCEHLQCWLLFVKACRLLCVRTVDRQSIETAHIFLKRFCVLFAELYGRKYCTANLHMLWTCVYFLVFSFERYKVVTTPIIIILNHR